MQPGDNKEAWASLLIRSLQLYEVSDELGIYSNQFQIIGAMVAAIGNQLGVLSSEYALEGDRLQILAALHEAEVEFEKENDNDGRRGNRIKELEGRFFHQMEMMDNKHQSQADQLRQQVEQLQRQIRELREILEQHIRNR